MKKRAVLLPILLLTALACTIFVGGPDFPEPPVPVSTEAAESLKTQIKAAVEAAALSGIVTLQISEEQITSYLAFRQQAQENPLFTEPQVYLRDGAMQIYGKAQRGYFVANIKIELTVGVDAEGRPDIQITSADFGPFPAPEGLKGAMTAIIEEAYVGSLGPVASGFRIESIAITDGVMTVTGRLK